MADYKTVKGVATATIYEKKSEFIADIAHVKTQIEAEEFLSAVKKKYYDARHHCFAYILKQDNVQKQSDDGEPSKTAGMPILEIIRHSELQDVIIVVSRYFGGTLLGTGGLVRAYSSAAKQAVSAAEILNYSLCVDVKACIDYSLYDKFTLLCQNNNAKIVNTDFKENISVTIRCILGEEQMLIYEITTLTKGTEPFVSSPIFDIF